MREEESERGGARRRRWDLRGVEAAVVEVGGNN